MTAPRIFACTLCACAVHAAASGAEHLRYRINGLEVAVQYARGADAERLVAKHLAQGSDLPRGGPANWTTQGRWRQLASVEANVSRVLQVRGSGAGTEAILSSLDLRRDPARSMPVPLWLPPSSAVVNEVQMLDGTPAQQWTVRSAWRRAPLGSWLSAAARMQGWTARERTPEGLQLQRGSELLQVTLLPAPEDRTASVAIFTRWGGR
jgi:hypothetical protein